MPDIYREIPARVRLNNTGISKEFNLKVGVNKATDTITFQLTSGTSLVIQKKDLMVALDADPKLIEKGN